MTEHIRRVLEEMRTGDCVEVPGIKVELLFVVEDTRTLWGMPCKTADEALGEIKKVLNVNENSIHIKA